MREEVCLEVGALVEGSATRVALVWRLVKVKNAVHSQRATLTKAFAALATLEGLLFTVNVPWAGKKILHYLIMTTYHVILMLN